MGGKTFFDICQEGTLKEVRTALANGADVNERDKGFYKRTSLMEAVSDAKEPLVSLLLQQPGIQVNAKNNNGWTALHFAACRRGDEGRKVTKLLLNFPGINTRIINNSGETPFVKAIAFSNKEFFLDYQKKMQEAKKIDPNEERTERKKVVGENPMVVRRTGKES